MNKEAVIEIFFKERETNEKILEMTKKYSRYLSEVVIQPANLERYDTIVTETSDRKSKSRSKSNLGKTLSICSAFSRITIDQNIYADIIKNRKDHDLFLELEKEDIKEKQWYYKDERKNIFGPYSA